jgi:uncharacterized protein YndB with AHSA1/START domain
MDGTPEDVFDCFANSELLNKWFTTGARQHFRVGGRYSNDDFDEGVFTEIDPPYLVRFTWENARVPSGGVVTVRIRELEDGRSQVSITQSRMDAAKWVPEQRIGWSWALDSLRSLVETGRGIRYGEWEKLQTERQRATAVR